MKASTVLALVFFAHGVASSAAPVQLKCQMQTVFHKNWIGGTTWDHVERTVYAPAGITKYFLIDRERMQVSVYNARQGKYSQICGDGQPMCVTDWSGELIRANESKVRSKSSSPHLDFRRSFELTDHDSKAKFVIADFGDSDSGVANMDWTYEGLCERDAAGPPSPRAGGPGPHATTFVDAIALPVSDAERDRVWEPRRGNTVTGLSAGGRSWFHFWYFDHGLGYTGDGADMTAEGAPRQWFIGKTSDGSYRICEKPIPQEGESGCYPFPSVKVGDTWTEQDVYGPAIFTLLPGRQ